MKKILTILYCIFFGLATIGFIQSFDLYGLIIWLLMAWLAYTMVIKVFFNSISGKSSAHSQITNNKNKSEIVQPNVNNLIEFRINELTKENPSLSEEDIKEIILKEEKEKMVSDIVGNLKIEVTRSSYYEDTSRQKDTTSSEVDLSYTKTRKLSPNFVVLDFETTGLSHFENEIIQVAAVRYNNFIETDKFVTYVKPSVSIPNRITEITGITNNDVKDAPKINEMLPKLVDFIKDDIIVAHNAPFDMKFLLANIHKGSLEYRKFKVIDTLTLARKHIDSTKNHKLPTLKGFLRLNNLNSHEALHDCYVTAELYKYCYEETLVNK